MRRRLDQALDLADVGIEMMWQNLRRRNPGASTEEIDRLHLAWLDARPGAELGDCPGPARVLSGT